MFHRFRHWSVLRQSMVVLLVLGIAMVGYTVGRKVRRHRLADAEIARLRAAGVPSNVEQLNEFVAIPEGEADATAAWRKPLDKIEAGAIGRHPYGLSVLDNSYQLVPGADEPWAELEQARKYVDAHQQLYADIDRAVAADGRCLFIADYAGGAEILLPHVQHARMIAKLLKLRLYVHAHEGNLAAAADDLGGMLAVAETLRYEPCETSQLVRMALLREALPVLAQMLPDFAEAGTDLGPIERRLRSVDHRRAFELAVLGDRVMCLTALDDPATTGAGRVPPGLYSAWVGDDKLEVLQLTRQVDDLAAQAWPAPLALADRFAELDWQRTQVRAPSVTTHWFSPAKWAQKIAADVQYFAIGQARIHGAIAGVGCARYQATRGTAPPSLDALVPEFLDAVPIDPFTGERLRMTAREGVIVIYSVGANRQDDGGREQVTTDEDGDRDYTAEPDIVFRMKWKADD